MRVPNWSVQLDSASQYVEQVIDEDDGCQNEFGDREEWMHLAERKSKTDSNNDKQNYELPEAYWESDRLKYTSQQVGDMAYWINTQKNNYMPEVKTNEISVDINSLNNAQWTAYDIVK